MKGIRREFIADFNSKIVIEAPNERMTLSELAVKFGVAGTQIST